MKLLAGILVGIAIGIAIGYFVHVGGDRGKKEAVAENAAAGELPETKPGEVKLSKAQIKSAGIELSAAKALSLPEIARAQGRILDPAPFLTMSLEVQSAEAALHASTLEYERVKTLFGQNQNASARALETAEAAMKRDEVLLRGAKMRLDSFLGPSLSNATNLNTILEALGKFEASLARVDYPGILSRSVGNEATVTPLIDEHRIFQAKVLGRAGSSEPQTPGSGFLLWVGTNALPINSAIMANLEIAGEAIQGFEVPESSVLQEGNSTMVFVSSGEGTFHSVPVSIERSVPGGYFVTNGIVGSEQIVISGAQNLLSEVNRGSAED